MYACMRRISRKRLACLLHVGRRYHRCVQKAPLRQLRCWFRQMDFKYLCFGTAVKDCRRKARSRYRACLRRCPRCRVR